MNNKFNKIIILFFFSILFSQKISHEPILTHESGFPIKIEVFTDLQGQGILKYNLFYRKSGQIGYFQESLESQDGIYYSGLIPSEFAADGFIEYYILLETDNNIISYPEINPNLNPLLLKISKKGPIVEGFNQGYNIISPLPNEIIDKSELVISLSYFELDNLDIESIKVFINDIDLTRSTIIKPKHLVLLNPKGIKNGKHQIKVLINDRFGKEYAPIIWSFAIGKTKKNRNFKYSGKIWTDYINNNIEDQESNQNVSNLEFNGQTEWINFKLKIKNSSLENNLSQPYNRYNLSINNNFLLNLTR